MWSRGPQALASQSAGMEMEMHTALAATVLRLALTARLLGSRHFLKGVPARIVYLLRPDSETQKCYGIPQHTPALELLAQTSMATTSKSYKGTKVNVGSDSNAVVASCSRENLDAGFTSSDKLKPREYTLRGLQRRCEWL